MLLRWCYKYSSLSLSVGDREEEGAEEESVLLVVKPVYMNKCKLKFKAHTATDVEESKN